MGSYVYTITDDQGSGVEGFSKVAEVMTKHCQDLLGKQGNNRAPVAEEII